MTVIHSKLNAPQLASIRRLEQTNRQIARALERLSSGQRINSARDDAAGLATSVRLDSKVRELTLINREISNNMSLLRSTESSLASQLEILQKIREIALQASNGLMDDTQRSTLNSEVQSLMEEFDRIAEQSQFGNQKLLNGSLNGATLRMGVTDNDQIELSGLDTRANQMFTKIVSNLEFEESVLPFDTASGLLIKDLNGDGREDYMALGGNGHTVYLTNEDGTFEEKAYVNMGANRGGAAVRLGDINGDGIDDLIWGEASSRDWLQIRLGNGDGTFSVSQTFLMDTDTNSLLLEDVDGDGDLDFIIDQSQSVDADIRIWLNDGIGNFTPTYTFASNSTVSGMRYADIDGDEVKDLFFSTSSGVSFNSGNGDGSFGATQVIAGLEQTGFQLGDLDNDGDLDFVRHGGTSQPGGRIFHNDGNGNFTDVGEFILGVGGDTPAGIGLSDLDGDGLLDLVGANLGNRRLNIYQGVGDGYFGDRIPKSTSYWLSSFNFRDMNGDGFMDIIANTGSGGQTILYTQQTEVVDASEDISVATQSQAEDTLELLDQGISQLIAKQAELGAIQNRLEYAYQTNQLAAENTIDAKSQVLDADLAAETADLMRLQIMQQASLAALSQSNLNLSLVLQLLE
jgi:flagellin